MKIAIVSAGCVLPGANDTASFLKILEKNECLVREMPTHRMNPEIDIKKGDDNKVPTAFAAFVSEEQVAEINKKNNWQGLTKLNTFCLEAMRQARENFSLPKKVFCSIGCMFYDELERFAAFHNISEKLNRFVLKETDHSIIEDCDSFYKEKTKGIDKLQIMYASSIKQKVRDLLNINAELLLVDAACASSFAAIEIAIQKLLSKEVDFAFSGGMDSSLSLSSFLIFAKIKSLAIECSYPFDSRATGVSQGEGSVIFGLMRLEDAKRENKSILGVIKSCYGTNDGKNGSLISPTIDGQLRCYQNAYHSYNKDEIDFIEGHATGTKVGDVTEMKSTDLFFKRKLPISSIKEQFGHTKATAGALSLLKAINIIKEKKIFGSHIFKEPIVRNNLFVSKEDILLKKEKIAVGVTSLGFGGQNYHLIVDNDTQLEPSEEKKIAPEKIVSIGYYCAENEDCDAFVESLGIPPHSKEQVDDLQKKALFCVYKVNAMIDLNPIANDRISVFSSGIIGTKASDAMEIKLLHDDFAHYINGASIKQSVLNHKNEYPNMTNDSSPGVLNSVVAGRICNYFDYRGRSINIDSDVISYEAAFSVAKTFLNQQISDVVIIVNQKEVIKKDQERKRDEVFCRVFTRESIANDYNFQILEEWDITSI
jgi:acyl transferase domain-containing protein